MSPPPCLTLRTRHASLSGGSNVARSCSRARFFVRWGGSRPRYRSFAADVLPAGRRSCCLVVLRGTPRVPGVCGVWVTRTRAAVWSFGGLLATRGPKKHNKHTPHSIRTPHPYRLSCVGPRFAQLRFQLVESQYTKQTPQLTPHRDQINYSRVALFINHAGVVTFCNCLASCSTSRFLQVW